MALILLIFFPKSLDIKRETWWLLSWLWLAVSWTSWQIPLAGGLSLEVGYLPWGLHLPKWQPAGCSPCPAWTTCCASGPTAAPRSISNRQETFKGKIIGEIKHWISNGLKKKDHDFYTLKYYLAHHLESCVEQFFGSFVVNSLWAVVHCGIVTH